MATTPSTASADQDYLQALCQRILDQRKIILVSNRGPVEYHLSSDGQPRARRGSGGLVTALNLLCQFKGLTWIAAALGEGDRHVGAKLEWRSVKSPLPGHNVNLRFISSSRRTYHRYYNVICNPLLWFLQHYMWNSPYSPNVDSAVHNAWDHGYMAMNKLFVEAVVDECRGETEAPVVMLQDYHLYPAAHFIRQALPNAILQHFTHIPWPNSSYWLLLPGRMRRTIHQGLCAADLVGLQTPRDVHNFLECCEAFLSDSKVNYGEDIVEYDGRTVRVKAYPASISVEGLRRTADSARVRDYESRLLPHYGDKTIIRVDRTEPSKNIVRGLRAYGLLLERHPGWQGVAKFVAFLVPSRTHIRQYERYSQTIEEETNRLNEKYGTADWQPITTIRENNYTQAIAGMKLYDVLLVNSVIDGMNLVAKEGPIVNTKHGVLILSEGAGAHQQLAAGALSVSPADLEGTAEALHTALSMPLEERKRLADILIDSIEREDANNWLYRQLQDIYDLTFA